MEWIERVTDRGLCDPDGLAIGGSIMAISVAHRYSALVLFSNVSEEEEDVAVYTANVLTRRLTTHN